MNKPRKGQRQRGKEVRTKRKKDGKEPRAPVDKDRALQHALLSIRRAWAADITDFDNWGGVELDPEPMILHDLNGQVLFYEFGVMDGSDLVGSVKTGASKILGSAVPTVEFGRRGWDPAEVEREARDLVKKRFPKARITDTELVCFSYPKIGLRVEFKEPELGDRSLILDVSDLSLVETFGADELEGYTSWSFYGEIGESEAEYRERLWERADRELDAARRQRPRYWRVVSPQLN